MQSFASHHQCMLSRQPWAKYWRQTLVFPWNSALREKLDISWNSNISDYLLSIFLVSYNYAWYSSVSLSHRNTEHWYPTTPTSSFSTAPSGTCSYQFSVCSNPFFCTKFPMDFLCYIAVSSHIHSEATSDIHLLSVAHFHLFSHLICRGLSLVV